MPGKHKAVREYTFSTYYKGCPLKRYIAADKQKPQHLNNRGIYSKGNYSMLM